jgi:hypothetical protein
MVASVNGKESGPVKTAAQMARVIVDWKNE